MDFVKLIEQDYIRDDLPPIQPGDRVRVHVKIREGGRERIQVFEGDVIARDGQGVNETITVRRISFGVGVERVFPLHAPTVDQIERVRQGQVRRAKLYYLRNRRGRAAKIREKTAD